MRDNGGCADRRFHLVEENLSCPSCRPLLLKALHETWSRASLLTVTHWFFLGSTAILLINGFFFNLPLQFRFFWSVVGYPYFMFLMMIKIWVIFKHYLAFSAATAFRIILKPLLAPTRKAKTSHRGNTPGFWAGWQVQPYRRDFSSPTADSRRENSEAKLSLNKHPSKPYFFM